jgi:hypothetical protein
MKKSSILIIAIMLMSLTQINAQLKYGPRVGLGSTSLGGGSTSFGFQVGIFLNAEIRDRIGFQPEVLFSVKNGVNKFTTTNAAGAKQERKTTYTFTYLDIPLYVFMPISKHITFLFGPQISSVSKATQKTTGDGVTSADEERTDVEGVDANIGIAGGIDFELSSPLKFGLRFSTTGGETFGGKSSFVGVTLAYSMDW